MSIFEKYGYLSNLIFGIIEGLKHIKNSIKSIDYGIKRYLWKIVNYNRVMLKNKVYN